MPTKMNRVRQQPYVPEGNGDASGEYAEQETGSNTHYVSPDDTKRQLGYQTEQPKPQSETPKELSNKLNGKKDNKISDDMKSAEYTNKFVENGVYDGVFGLTEKQLNILIKWSERDKDLNLVLRKDAPKEVVKIAKQFFWLPYNYKIVNGEKVFVEL